MNEYNRSDDNLLEEGLSALNLFCYVRDFTKNCKCLKQIRIGLAAPLLLALRSADL